MAYTRELSTLDKDLNLAWPAVLAALSQMYPASEIRPRSVADIFQASLGADGAPRLDIKSLVMRVPEKARNEVANLYVVTRGWITFAPPVEGDPRRSTKGFQTEIGYFRANGSTLNHVYGAHYDMDERLAGHPVFHAQMSSQLAFADQVNEQFHVDFAVGADHAAGLMKNVRTPIAQMDVFSVVTQVAADHLLSENSTEEVKDAFARLRTSCDFFIGAAARLTQLNQPAAARCYRSTHWYVRL